MDKREHWQTVYQTKSSSEVSWYEPDPKQSLERMQAELGPSFEPVECSEYLHTTPTGKPQQFFFGTYKRVC